MHFPATFQNTLVSFPFLRLDRDRDHWDGKWEQHVVQKIFNLNTLLPESRSFKTLYFVWKVFKNTLFLYRDWFEQEISSLLKKCRHGFSVKRVFWCFCVIIWSGRVLLQKHCRIRSFWCFFMDLRRRHRYLDPTTFEYVTPQHNILSWIFV